MDEGLKKILVIRLSSIGDIVLTSPVVRCAKKQTGCTIHFLTKKRFDPILTENPYIDKIYSIERNISEIIDQLKEENYDLIVDLHKNIRSSSVITKLNKPHTSFPKLNIKKWIAVNFKINILPDVHIIDRYFRAVEPLKIKNDNRGLDYFIPEIDNVKISELPDYLKTGFTGFVIGGHHNTKLFPDDKVIRVCDDLNMPVILLGGPEDEARGKKIAAKSINQVFNACGKYNINQSASIIKHSEAVISNDTGLMHVAAAFNKKIISIWGNTIPEFGMYPYYAREEVESRIFEIKGLYCRPCSKIGFKKCPLGHFKCMRLISEDEIAETANRFQTF